MISISFSLIDRTSSFRPELTHIKRFIRPTSHSPAEPTDGGSIKPNIVKIGNSEANLPEGWRWHLGT